ncbi:hypothetical protein AB4Z17_23120 [Paenibacillus sp. TAF43_2]
MSKYEGSRFSASSMIDHEHSRYTITKTEQSFATVYNELEE